LPKKTSEDAYSTGPLYIGDESEGIEFGPVQEHPQRALAAEVVAPIRHNEEPIAKAVREGVGSFTHWWNHGPLTTGAKVGLIVAALVVAIFHGGWLIPTAVVLGCVYLVYLGVRILAGAIDTSTSVSSQPVAAPYAVSWEQHGRLMLREKTGGDTIGELTGSMLTAAMITGVLAVIMNAIGGQTMNDSVNPLAGPIWLWLMTTLGTWLILAAGKCCERTSGEAIKRRFGMLVIGLLFGAIAFASSQYLMVKFGGGLSDHGIPAARAFHDMYDSSGAPKLAAFLAYFAALFATISWWKQCDPLRSSRLRISPIVLTVLAAWLWQLVLPFPQPWGFMIASGMAIATQLSAPWLSPAQRTADMARRQQMMT